MMGNSSPAQQSALDALLMIATNPKLLEKNLTALKESMEAHDAAFQKNEKSKAEAQTQLAAALAAEQSLKPKQQQVEADFAAVQEQRSVLEEDRRLFEKQVADAKAELMAGRDNLNNDISKHGSAVTAHNQNVEALKKREKELSDREAVIGQAEEQISKRLVEADTLKAEFKEKLDGMNALAGKKK